MKWEDFKNKAFIEEVNFSLKKTDIECPVCGKDLWKRTDIVLTTYPAQYQYECECGWVGYAFQ